MPSPPNRAIQPARAANRITTPRPREMTRDSFGRSTAVKYPDPTTLKPTIRKETLKIRNTDAEYARNSVSSFEIKTLTNSCAPPMQARNAAPARPTVAARE